MHEPIHRAHQPPGEQGDIKSKMARVLINRFFLRREQVDQQGCQSLPVEVFRHRAIAGTEAAAAAAMREQDNAVCAGWPPQCTFQMDGATGNMDALFANLRMLRWSHRGTRPLRAAG